MTKHFSKEDYLMMQAALNQAKIAFENHEVPIGAVISLNGNIIASAYNQMETKKDATAHAEILCIRAASQVLGDWRLQDVTLYTTLEPCAMCAGSILLSRIKRVVWGAPDKRHGAHGSWVDLFSIKHPTHTLLIEGGLYEEDAANLMREFFKQRREDERRIQTTF